MNLLIRCNKFKKKNGEKLVFYSSTGIEPSGIVETYSYIEI